MNRYRRCAIEARKLVSVSLGKYMYGAWAVWCCVARLSALDTLPKIAKESLYDDTISAKIEERKEIRAQIIYYYIRSVRERRRRKKDSGACAPEEREARRGRERD